MRRRLLTVLGTIVAVVALLVGAGWAFQRRLIYFPSGDLLPLQQALPGASEVTLTTGDGLELGGWYLPAFGEEMAAAVVFNGNAGNRSDRVVLARGLAERGISTLLFDYRGYGGNPGSPSEPGLLEDGRAAVEGLARLSGAPPIYFGESLGSAVAAAVAVDRPPAALVLRSPFTSLVDVGKTHYPFLPVGWLLKDTFPTLDAVAAAGVPVLVIAGPDDEIVPFRLSERVFAAAPGMRRLVAIEGARHNDYQLTVGDRLLDETAAFVAEVLGDADAG